MRAVVDAKEFSKALDKVSEVLGASKYIPALREVMVRFSGGRCVLTGTDIPCLRSFYPLTFYKFAVG